jgi:hypothetical protein
MKVPSQHQPIPSTFFISQQNSDNDLDDFIRPPPSDEIQQQVALDDQMERFSETSSIELVIQGGPNETQLNSSAPLVKIPESHNFVFNLYPGTKQQQNSHIPIDIVKSFAPVTHSEQTQVEDGSDLFNAYVHDPYNLTLHVNNDAN